MNLPAGFRSKSKPEFPWRSRAPVPGWALFTVMVVILCSYCLYMPAQREVESRFAGQLARRLQLYPLEFPDSPITNLAQILYGVHGGYPYQWHEWFRAYGSDAGFAHSLEEKYVLVPPGVFHRGELYWLSAQTFLEHSQPHRTVIYRHTNDFWCDSVSERWIQQAFQNAGKVVPMPVSSAPPPPPPPSTTRSARYHYLSSWLETRGEFSRLEWKGLSPRWARVLERIVGWGLGVICASLIGYCLWPVRIREEVCPQAASLTTAQKIWSTIGWTVLFFLAMGFMLPGFGSDRGYGQLWFHLILPYFAAADAMVVQRSAWSLIVGILFFGQIAFYVVVLGYAWIRNRLGLAAIVLTGIHVFAIAFSILVVSTKKW